MKQHDERLEQLLHTRSFSELAADEKEFVVDALGSEEEFTKMKKMDEWLAQEEHSLLDPDKKTLASLVVRMRELHEPASLWQRFVAFKIPGYAALLALVCATAITLLLRVEPTEKVIAGREIHKIDTVYITRRDTIIMEKIIYAAARTPKFGKPKQVEVIPETMPVGVSMKEKDELNKLLVSGSD